MSLFLDAAFIRLIREEAEIGLGVAKQQATLAHLIEHGTVEQKVDYLLNLKVDHFVHADLEQIKLKYCLRLWEAGPLVTYAGDARLFSMVDSAWMVRAPFGPHPLRRVMVDHEYWRVYVDKPRHAAAFLGNPAE